MNLMYDLNIKAIQNSDEDLFKRLETTEDIELEIVQSKSGHPVPKYKDILIHSQFDPEKEAMIFLSAYESIISSQSILIVMGYGFGYHVEALAKMIKDKEKYIFVIEPDISLFKKSLMFRDISSFIDDVTFIVGYPIEKLFETPGFYKLLTVARHPIGFKPAVSLNQDYFIEFVTRRSSNLTKHLRLEASDNKEMISILEPFSEDELVDITKLTESIMTREAPLTKTEKILLLMSEIAK
jgi:hypothetical protein